jgi:hypothetical protein
MPKNKTYIDQLVASWKLFDALLPTLEDDVVDNVMTHMENIETLIAPINPAL